MELTSEQKHDISVELNASDIYETVPFLNKVLAAIGYVDRLDDDSEREELRWTKRKEPLIKDKKIRKAVRAWWKTIPDAITDKRVLYKKNQDLAVGVYTIYCGAIYPETLEVGKMYTIAELCGEEEE